MSLPRRVAALAISLVLASISLAEFVGMSMDEEARGIVVGYSVMLPLLQR